MQYQEDEHVEKNMALEGLRGIACLNVVLGHFLFAFFPYLANDVRPYPGAVAKYAFEEVMRFPPFTLLYLADSAVSIFFVLSGYVLTQRFYVTGQIVVLEAAASKRFVRLVLPAFVSVSFAWALLAIGAYANNRAGLLGASGWVMDYYVKPVSFWTAIKQGAFGAPLFGQVELNSPLWTIQVELIGSILLFACYSLFSKSRAMLILWFLYFACIFAGRNITILHYVAFLGGSLLHLAEARLRMAKWLAPMCLVLGIVGVSFTHAPAFALMDHAHLPNLTPYGPNLKTDRVLFWHTLGAVFLVAGVVGFAGASRILNHRIPVYLGRISFSLYLLHWPLICSLSFHAAEFGQFLGMSYWAYALLALIALLAVLFPLAEVFYRWVDAPSVRLANWTSSSLRKHPQLERQRDPVANHVVATSHRAER